MSEQQRMMGEAAAQFCAQECTPSRTRACRDRQPGFDRPVWGRMAELGWLGVVVPEADAGLGLGFGELAALLLPWGESCAPEPLVAVTVLCARLLAHADGPARAQLLRGLCDATVLPALAWPGPLASASPVRVRGDGDSFVLSGCCDLIVPADADGWIVLGHCDAGPCLLWVSCLAEGATVQRQRRADGSFAATLLLADCEVPATNLVASPRVARAALRRALDEARIALAIEMAGMAGKMLAMTLDYMRTREQFGQPIARFQALQHRAVDLYIGVELAREVALAAAHAVDEGASGDALAVWASRAKARSSEVLGRLARECVQLHGAIGFTDEYALGLFVNRALVYCAWLGNHDFHVARYARLATAFEADMP